MAYNNTTSDKAISEFNDAISFLGRLNYIWYELMLARNNNDIEQMVKCLESMSIALLNDMSKEEEKLCDNYLNELNKELQNIRQFQLQNGYKTITSKFKQIEREFEKLLTRIYDKAGYQTKRSDDPYKALR